MHSLFLFDRLVFPKIIVSWSKDLCYDVTIQGAEKKPRRGDFANAVLNSL